MEVRRNHFSVLQVGIILLAVATALIHLTLNFPDPMFILNGLAYLGLVGALYLPLPFFKDHRRLVRFALMGLTFLTIILWAVFGERSVLGYVDKIIEVALLVLLWVEHSAERSAFQRKVSS